MKILAIGDFHGKFPKKLQKFTKEVDLVVSLGDYPSWSLKKEFFKHCYKKDVELWEVVGKTKYKKFKILDFKKGKVITEKLNRLPAQVLSVLGNYDCFADDVKDEKKPKGKKFWKWDWGRRGYFKEELKKCKNIRNISYSSFSFGNFVFIGMRGHSFPGKVKSKAYKKSRKILDNLFRKNKDKKIVFVSHIVPYQTKLDKITAKDADKKVRGKHYGSKLTRRIIDRYQPILALGGHMHENPGKDKIGKTLIVNPGAAEDGKAAIIDISLNKKGKIKVKFIK